MSGLGSDKLGALIGEASHRTLLQVAYNLNGVI
jgi:hypothetical protein